MNILPKLHISRFRDYNHPYAVTDAAARRYRPDDKEDIASKDQKAWDGWWLYCNNDICAQAFLSTAQNHFWDENPDAALKLNQIIATEFGNDIINAIAAMSVGMKKFIVTDMNTRFRLPKELREGKFPRRLTEFGRNPAQRFDVANEPKEEDRLALYIKEDHVILLYRDIRKKRLLIVVS